MPSTRRTHHLRLICSGLLGAQLLGCSPTPAVLAHAPETAPASSAANSVPAPVCERVKRASRIYTGFVGDVPASRMYIALDVVRPLEDRLGEVFCAEALAPCRPAHLTTIMLVDDLPSQARVTVEGGLTAPGKTFELVLLNQADKWQPEPSSLAAILAPCGGVKSAL